MGRASQRKGRAGELELARILQGYGYDVQPGRVQSYGEVPDLSGLPSVHIECKRNERLNVPEAMAQAVRDAERFQDGAPTVFHRRNHSGWLVTQRLEDWMDIPFRSCVVFLVSTFACPPLDIMYYNISTQI